MSEQTTPTSIPPRPTTMTAAIAEQAATAVAKEMAREALIDAAEALELARDIARCGERYSDGYALAKGLEDEGGYSPNSQWVDALDNFSDKVGDLIAAAEEQWARENAISPPFPLRSRVKLRSGETGEITDISSFGAAKYAIRIDGDELAVSQSRRRIVNFEDVAAI